MPSQDILLVVTDDPVFAETLGLELKKLTKMRPYWASSIKAARECAGRVFGIIASTKTTDKKGVAVVRALRESFPDAYILAVSPNLTPVKAHELGGAGAQAAVIYAPRSLSQLLASLGCLLGHQKKIVEERRARDAIIKDARQIVSGAIDDYRRSTHI